ncbi:hypothetical protein [Planctomyces sp. SH-PL62]|uniref:hypothetical protein n=1 Tax=Planctomyces sp. SH-PL62 TaxID=1636152 RepID=UPI00078CCAD8|nr:hypothetical protein [Planctomyces sp. SH-PL62]AMV40866.1 hypothetical protein VT85_25760 [Planctomyces sp. SH-PL62]
MSDVDEIRRQMALIRREMHTSASNVVSEVEQAMDWRSVIRNHPYIALGAGLAVGYFVVPRRKKTRRVVEIAADALPLSTADAAPRPLLFQPPAPPEKPSKPLGRRLLSWGVGMLWPLVGQSVQAYAAVWLEDQLKQHLNLKPPGEFVPPSSSGRPGESYDGGPARSASRRG